MPELEVVALLACVSFVAGVFDAIAGGGGLIVVPALLLAGLDPVTAIATNKLQGTFGTASATFAFARAGHLNLRAHASEAALAFGCAALGALLVQWLPGRLVAGAVPVVLVAVALYFAFAGALRDAVSPPRPGAKGRAALFGLGVVPLVALYDGAFGPGAGSFYMLGIVALVGAGAVAAVARTKLLNVSSNAGSLAVFLVAGQALVMLGLVLGVANALGARLGALLAMRFGTRLVRPLVVLVCLALAARLLSDPAHPLRAALGV